MFELFLYLSLIFIFEFKSFFILDNCYGIFLMFFDAIWHLGLLTKITVILSEI